MATEPQRPLRGLLALAAAPVDPAGFVVFRVGFGLLAAAAAVRFVARGWVQALLLSPGFHFTWLPGLVVPPAPVLYGLFALQAAAGVGIALGRSARPWLVVWLLCFGYVELLDKALYLNHYVLFTLLGAWLLLSPATGYARLGGAAGVPWWTLVLLRLQVGSVYFWAGVAKLNADWLLRGEPLATWLGARGDLPLLGPWLAHPATALSMSWAGAAYDLAIVPLLLFRRTAALGFALVVGFHAAVGLLFPIGIFPWLMVLSATLLLPPDWPRRFVGAARAPLAAARGALPLPAAAGLLVLGCAIVLLPIRSALEPGDVRWGERGFRFAWRVMLIEKTGLVDFRVVEREGGRVWKVMPGADLTPLQHRQMRTQPDMIRDYALHLRALHAAEGRDVAVYADAHCSLNGRPVQRLLRQDVDLTLPVDALEAATWIVPLAVGQP